jgi:hypothetical protein
MGFTHFFPRKTTHTLDKKRWDDMIADVRKVADNLPEGVELAGAFGEPNTKPTIDTEEICFNGVGEHSHETFRITRTPDARPDGSVRFNFCKTARKPYDLMATAVLLIIEKHFPGDFEIGTDGNLSDWRPAMRLLIGAGVDGELPADLRDEYEENFVN